MLNQMTEEKDWITLAVERQAIPKALRKESVEEFCNLHGLSPANYYYHISKPENQQRILDLVLRVAKDSAPDILERLVEKAVEGDMKAMDIYIDSIMKLAKNVDVKSDGKVLPVLVQFLNEKRTKDNSDSSGV